MITLLDGTKLPSHDEFYRFISTPGNMREIYHNLSKRRLTTALREGIRREVNFILEEKGETVFLNDFEKPIKELIDGLVLETKIVFEKEGWDCILTCAFDKRFLKYSSVLEQNGFMLVILQQGFLKRI